MSRPRKRAVEREPPFRCGDLAFFCTRAEPLVLRPFLVVTLDEPKHPPPADLRYSGILFFGGDQDRQPWVMRNLFMPPTKQHPFIFLAGVPEGSGEGQIRRRT